MRRTKGYRRQREIENQQETKPADPNHSRKTEEFRKAGTLERKTLENLYLLFGVYMIYIYSASHSDAALGASFSISSHYHPESASP